VCLIGGGGKRVFIGGASGKVQTLTGSLKGPERRVWKMAVRWEEGQLGGFLL